jgi:phosphate transport system protein
MTRVFDSDLQDLARATAEMGGLAERQISEAIEALSKRDSGRACRVIAADATIDLMQRVIEEKSVETIARRQPVADDLRQIVGVLRIASELERIGDLAKNIGKRIVAIGAVEIPRRSMRGVSHLAAFVQAQCRDVLDSFARRDVSKAVVHYMVNGQTPAGERPKADATSMVTVAPSGVSQTRLVVAAS